MEISKVTLKTKELKKMKDFYTETLGMPISKEWKESFQVSVGSSQLKFSSRNVEGDPYYHFAFNIPSNQFKEAKEWLKGKVELNYEEGENEANFPNLPAHSFYFYDPAENVVEFISRHSIAVAREEPFSQNSFLTISEISLTVDDAIKTGQQLIDIGINERDNHSISEASLNFMGDRATGAFILLVKPGRRWIFSEKTAAIYPIEIEVNMNDQIVVNENHEVIVNSSC
ncbi:VOC family protein [Alkalihalobacillus sp. R86527]|uniref:VOC family protein n=1 Tax=Alkalihalobacillus sp. R86527 TaxID=3093863 RepID=UPI00366CBDB8